jgi:hypothetical protein
MSYYGKGFAYNLGLFLAHAERKIDNREGAEGERRWFDGVWDHLIELETSPEVIGAISPETIKFRDFCQYNANDPRADANDIQSAIRWAKRLLYDWDRQNQIPADLAEYS